MAAQPTKKVLLKVIILGESNVGKTAILGKYVNDSFLATHKATIGADFMTKEITIEDKMITLQMWDTAGQERFKSLGNSFYRGADAAVLVYALDDKETFQKVEEWRSNFLNLSNETSEDFPILLLGNKSDLESTRAVQTTEGQRYATDKGMIFYETSALNGSNIRSSIEDLARKACARNTAPIFSADVIKELSISRANVEQPAPSAGCGCELL